MSYSRLIKAGGGWLKALQLYLLLANWIRIPRTNNSPKFHTGLLTFTKGEEKYLAEWLIYHLFVAEVDHIVLIDNNEVCGDYSYLPESVRIRVTLIHDCTPFSGVQTQVALFNEYVKKFMADFKWLALIDTDEFVFFDGFYSVGDFLESHLVEEHSSVRLYWQFYGPADPESFNATKSLILASLARAEEKYPPHAQYKSFFRCDRFFSFQFGPHEPLLYGGARPSKASGFLNHYYFRTEEFFELKRNRRQVAFGYADSDFSFDQNIIACSQVKTEDERFKPYRTKFKEFWLANQPPSQPAT